VCVSRTARAHSVLSSRGQLLQCLPRRHIHGCVLLASTWQAGLWPRDQPCCVALCCAALCCRCTADNWLQDQQATHQRNEAMVRSCRLHSAWQ
jgi:hypothetical protein